jgi:hypothetical protein
MPSPTRPELSEDTLPASLFAVRPAELKNDSCPNGRPSLGKRAFIPLVRFFIIFCIGVAAAFAWQSYGAREMVASSYPQLTGLAPRAEPVVQNTPDVIGLASGAAPSPDHAILLDLDAVRQSIDRLATSIASNQGRMASSADRMATTQEQIARGVDQIAASQGQIGRSVDRIATSQEQITRSLDQLTADQERMTREIAKLQEIEQSIRSRNSEPSPRPVSASAPKPVLRPASASPPKPVSRPLPEPTDP